LFLRLIGATDAGLAFLLSDAAQIENFSYFPIAIARAIDKYVLFPCLCKYHFMMSIHKPL